MGRKYGDIYVDTSTMGTIDRVQNILSQAQRMRHAESNQQFMEDTRNQLLAAENALNKWKSYTTDDTSIFNKDISNQQFNYHTDLETAWEGYRKEMLANGITYPDKEAFTRKFHDNFTQRIMTVARKFRAQREQIRAKTGIEDNVLLNKYMQKNHNADNLYLQTSSILGNDEAQQILGYSPPVKSKTWKKWAQDLLMKPSYTDPETGETIGGGMRGVLGFTIPGMALGAWQQYGEFSRNKADILKEAKANQNRHKQTFQKYKKGKNKGKFKLDKKGNKIPLGTKPGSGISAAEFMKKYNLSKSEAFGADGKPTKEFNKILNQKTLPETKTGKVLRAGRRNLKSLAGYGIGSTLGGELGELTGSEEAEFVGSVGGGIGGAIGMRKLWKKLQDPNTIKRLKAVAAKSGKKGAINKILAKLGVSALGYVGPQAIEPFSTAVGAAGTAWAMYDIYKIAKEVPALMDILSEGD
tara:strand:+ start:1408 stop:2811 length:1404 start_codon:yes stop_codon:yes gene_type:complete